MKHVDLEDCAGEKGEVENDIFDVFATMASNDEQLLAHQFDERLQ